MVSVNVVKGKESHSLSMSETESERKIPVKNPLSGIEEIKETEMMDVVEDNRAATAEHDYTKN